MGGREAEEGREGGEGRKGGREKRGGREAEEGREERGGREEEEGRKGYLITSVVCTPSQRGTAVNHLHNEEAQEKKDEDRAR